MKRGISIFIAIMMTLFLYSAAIAEIYNDVEIPDGETAFADEVISYDPGPDVAADYSDPTDALGIPDYTEATQLGQCSLGDNGSIILKFTNNSLTTSGNSDDDLWIFEVGHVEPGYVAISKDGSNWIDVGGIEGSVSGVDLDAYLGSGVELWGKYSYVKITDAGAGLTSGRPFPGVDIDAIAAISSDSPVATDEYPTAIPGDVQARNQNVTVYLNGSYSIPPINGTITAWEWTQLSGPTVALTNYNPAIVYFTTPATAPDALTFQLTVTGSNGLTHSATTIVNVINGHYMPNASINPQNQTVEEGATVTLISNSSDPNDSTDETDDGTIQSYLWEQLSGTTATLTSTNTKTLTFTAPVVGASGDALTFKLTVTDNDGLKDTATANVNVNKAEITNTAPVADAGDNQLVAPSATVTLDGTGSSDPDTGDAIASYSWTKISGSDVTLSNASSSSPTFTAPSSSGAIEFQLTVTDNGGLQGTDTVIINVSASNTAPDANAGDDQSVAAGASVTLDGSASSDAEDTTVTSYFWQQLSGSSVELSDPSSSQPTFTASAAGDETLEFELTVTDSEGLKDSDSVSIVVAPVPTAGGGGGGGGCFIDSIIK